MSVAKKIFDSFKPYAPPADRTSCGLSDGGAVNGLVMLVPGRLAGEVVGPLACQPGQVKAGQGKRQACGDRGKLFCDAGRQRKQQLSCHLGRWWRAGAWYQPPRRGWPSSAASRNRVHIIAT